MLQTPGHLMRGRQNESIRPGRMRLQQAIGRIIDLGVNGNFRQIAANQRHIVVLIHTTDAPNTGRRVLIAQTATQGIARIRGIGNHPARTNHRHRMLNQTRLRIIGMNLQESAHNNPMVWVMRRRCGEQCGLCMIPNGPNRRQPLRQRRDRIQFRTTKLRPVKVRTT